MLEASQCCFVIESSLSSLVLKQVRRQEEVVKPAKAVAEAKRGQWMRWGRVEKTKGGSCEAAG